MATLGERLGVLAIATTLVAACGGSTVETAAPDRTATPPPALIPGAITTTKPTILVWDTGRGMEGQVVVEVTNASTGWVNLEPEETSEPTTVRWSRAGMVTVTDKQGTLITGTEAGSVNDLRAYPTIIGPGRSGYMVASFDYSDVAAEDVLVDVAFTAWAPAEPLTLGKAPTFSEIEVAKVRGDEIEVTGVLDRGDRNGVTFVGVAYDAKGRIVGFVEHGMLQRADTPFSECCLPPKVKPKGVKEVRFIEG